TETPSTLQLHISNELVTMYGYSALKKHMQKRLELLKMQLLAEKLGAGIKSSGMDWEKEMENARLEAWSEYKQNKQND
ncbi:MAG: hypothetical protein DRJ05_08960, partial [Bacteroidetes bacterium]